MTADAATMMIAPTTLRTLPPASSATFPGRFPWSPVSTSILTAALAVDPGLWTTWRNRRIGPAPLPSIWFRAATGGPIIYRVDTVRAWLAGRRGEPYDAITDWQYSLSTEFGTDAVTPEQVRKWVHVYARATGPAVGDVRLNPAGFRAYLDGLSRDQ